MCTQRGFSSRDGVLKYKLKVGLVIGCAKTMNEANVCSHYNKINKYVTGTIIILLLLWLYTFASFNVFAHPITNPTFNLYFNIPSQLENPLCVHISNGSFYQVLLHIHCKQLGSQFAFYESIM